MQAIVQDVTAILRGQDIGLHRENFTLNGVHHNSVVQITRGPFVVDVWSYGEGQSHWAGGPEGGHSLNVALHDALCDGGAAPELVDKLIELHDALHGVEGLKSRGERMTREKFLEMTKGRGALWLFAV